MRCDQRGPSQGKLRHLHVLSVAYPLLPVTSGSAGGAEQILRLVEAGAVQAGYQSTVVAADGSRVCGKLLATPAATGTISENTRLRAHQIHRERIEIALAANSLDLIHYHGLDFLDYRPQNCRVPELATLHLPLEWYPPDLFGARNLNFNYVSESQAQTGNTVPNIRVIRNGVELDKFQLADEKFNYLLWLGRICPEKGTEIALRVAHALGLALVIAGPVHEFASHRTYFEKQIRPKLDGVRRHVGAVDADEKARLLSRARCLLIPSLAPETSSLVAMEAISSGTPVIAFRSGALPEIVEHGVTGFVVDSEEEMAEAVSRVDKLNANVLRAHAEARFSSDRMIREYLGLYQRIAALAA